MKPLIRLFFTDFWSGFDPYNNFFVNLLKLKYNLEITPNNPDFVIFSCYGTDYQKFNKSVLIFYTAENLRPSFWECNYSVSFDYNTYNDRNLRLPLYVLYGFDSTLLNPKNPNEILANKTKFCNFIVSNAMCKTRNEFFKILNSKKQVDSGGRYLNNIGREIPNKLEFIKDYRFTIAFENTSSPGYTTEKIFEPMKVNSIPIYWGNKLINREFNTKSFINVHDFGTLNECADYIIELDSNKEKLTELLKETWFINNEFPKEFNDQYFLDFFDPILTKKNHNEIIQWQAKTSYFIRNSRFRRMLNYRIRENWIYLKSVKLAPITKRHLLKLIE
jgi:hypothetical protein